MRSKVIKLYDHTQAEVPAELIRWRIPEEQVDRELESLARSHAREIDADAVQTGDSVFCRGESAVPRWNKPVLLFYPGHGLCEQVLEDALVGMKPGESRTVAASEGEVTLTVTRVVRREAHPIDDELVKLENVQGVETLADYRKWYRDKTEKWNHDHQMCGLARHLLEEIVAKSEYDIDQAEELAWCEEQAAMLRKFDEERGVDPTIPEEGVVFLTEEQVRQKYIDKCRPLFRGQVAYPVIAEALSGMDRETLYQAEAAEEEKRWKKYFDSLSPEEQKKLQEQQEKAKAQAEARGMTELDEESRRSMTFHNKAEALLRDYSLKLLEV